MSQGSLVGAIDQGTSSSRFIVFNSHTLETVFSHQVELIVDYPQTGWVEVDAASVYETVVFCMKAVENKLSHSLKAIGITNQRETCLLWARKTGKPATPAIIWSDLRTAEIAKNLQAKYTSEEKEAYRLKCGLPFSTYFSGIKLKWMLDNYNLWDSWRNRELLFGTIDTWLIWKLTNGVHVTDVTNASRTMLMNLETLDWDSELCNIFGIKPDEGLPRIVSSAEVYGTIRNDLPFGNVVISGCLGDQHAALLGQGCFAPGSAKTTYGTGLFCLCNAGTQPIFSHNGLISTVGFKLGVNQPTLYALEGSVAGGGSLIRWLRDNLCIIKSAKEVESLANTVPDSAGVCIVPAFSGLLAPHWDSTARGILIGFTQFTNTGHIARAALEALAFQVCDLLSALESDGISMEVLSADGGATRNTLLMQIQSDLANIKVQLSSHAEATALGAALAAAIGAEIYSVNFLRENIFGSVSSSASFTPQIKPQERKRRKEFWAKAIERCKNYDV